MNIYIVGSRHGEMQGIANSHDEAFSAYCACYEPKIPESIDKIPGENGIVNFLWDKHKTDMRVVSIIEHVPDFVGKKPNRKNTIIKDNPMLTR